MKKNKYEHYFGKNIPRKIFLVSCGCMCLGAFNWFVGIPWIGAQLIVFGGIAFFFTVHKQVTNKAVDDKVYETQKEYAKKHLEGKLVNKRELTGKEFTAFSGYIRDSGDVRFRMCSDRKLRTSKFYVTAFSLDNKECMVSAKIYNLITEQESEEQFICAKSTDRVEFSKTEIEFPKGNYECVLSAEDESGKRELRFYLPVGDYVAEQFIVKMNTF